MKPFLIVSHLTSVLLVGSNCSLAGLIDPPNPIWVMVKKEARILGDICELSSLLLKGKAAETLQPALIQGKGLTPVGVLAEQGFSPDSRSSADKYITGKLILLDPSDLKAPGKTFRYCLPVHDMHRASEELGRGFSPYRSFEKENLVLCGRLEAASGSIITELPVSYWIPSEWVIDALRLGEMTDSKRRHFLLNGQSPSSPLEICMLATALLDSPSKGEMIDQMLPLLRSGDMHSKAMVMMLILSHSGSEGHIKLADYLNATGDREQVYAVLLAMAALQLRGDVSVQESAILRQMIATFCEKAPEGTDQIKELLNWLEHH